MGFVIVTGMSGAGKSQALKMLEDIGYFCIDNLPIPFITKIAGWMEEDDTVENIALGIDSRSGTSLSILEKELEHLDKKYSNYKILFLDASTEVLVKRFKETRRTHPLSGVGRVDRGIDLERKKIEFLKKRADYIIDTSHLLIRDLKSEMDKIFLEGKQYSNFIITVVSFGFKYGIPVDADLVFDVRFLPNPYYIPELKYKTGNDKDVFDYVMSSKEAGCFLDKLEDMLTFLVPNYIIEGKNQLVIGIGCTGGKHRSVTLARSIAKRLDKLEYGIKLEHRDIEK
ncbi:RNase adapter RapZ [Velocimicrobium porci]|uniref:RNase adapter RapZ n=1 Tax=Velocimicrobium porci TaxID=2606634 RepID=A0A6L5XVI5_9FIRM|nr:RNase adapter RapZ [Velocimicrobium porci]MSS62762.1 RNase adapter RapZ [Velocimicrobium porci]